MGSDQHSLGGTHLIKHEGEEHGQPGVLVHHLFELFENGVEGFWVLVDSIDGAAQKLVVVSLVLGEPVTSLSSAG